MGTLAGRLWHFHGLHVVSEPELLKDGTVWRLQPREGRLLLEAEATRESRMFWMAHVLGVLEQRAAIDLLFCRP